MVCTAQPTLPLRGVRRLRERIRPRHAHRHQSVRSTVASDEHGGSYRKYFAQMNFGPAGIAGPAFLKDAKLEGGWGARLSYLDFYNYRAGDATSHEHATSLHFCCMVRYGPPYAQLIAQLDAERIITSSTYIRTRGVSASVGIQPAYGRIAAEP